MIHSFTELRERAGAVRPQTVAVACAHDAHTLEAVLHAAQEGILNYLLIGHPEEILSIGRSLGHAIAPEAVIPAATDEEAAAIAVATVRRWLNEHPDVPMTVVFNVFSATDESLYRPLLGL